MEENVYWETVLALVTSIDEEWRWPTRDLLLFFFFFFKLYSHYSWQDSCVADSQIWLHFFPCAQFYLLTHPIFRDGIQKFSSTQRRSLNEKLKPLFCVSLQSHICLLHHIATLPGLRFSTELVPLCQAGPETQQTCPASQLWHYLRCFHHANVARRPLVQNWILFGHWRAGKGDTWLSAPIRKCLLRPLTICGTKSERKANAHRQVAQARRPFSSDQVKRAGSAMSCYRNENQVGTISRRATIYV